MKEFFVRPNCIDTEDEIPPSLALPKRRNPLFDKEGPGEILRRSCLDNKGNVRNTIFCGIRKLKKNATSARTFLITLLIIQFFWAKVGQFNSIERQSPHPHTYKLTLFSPI
jgi:hypothetical protein